MEPPPPNMEPRPPDMEPRPPDMEPPPPNMEPGPPNMEPGPPGDFRIDRGRPMLRAFPMPRGSLERSERPAVDEVVITSCPILVSRDGSHAPGRAKPRPIH